MTFQTESQLDDTDWAILRELQADARLSFSALGRRVNLSPPAVAERVRRLESAGVIAGYQARVDPARAGQPVAAFIQMRCNDERCLLRTTTSSDYPEVVEIHKLSGEYCVHAAGARDVARAPGGADRAAGTARPGAFLRRDVHPV